MSDTICKDCGKRIGSDSIHTCSPQLKAPSVPSSVQEITRLIQPYVAACLKFNYTPMELIEQAEADVNEAFKPLEAALTALVEKNHELQFSLDGVNAMRSQMPEEAILHRMKYHPNIDGDGDWELFSADIGCDKCVDVLIVDAAKVAVNAMRIQQEWQPIETAPKDGTEILLYAGPQTFDGKPVPERNTSGHWLIEEGYIREHRDLDGRWIGQDESDGYEGWMSWDGGFTEENPPTHWMPRPAAPSGNESNGGAS